MKNCLPQILPSTARRLPNFSPLATDLCDEGAACFQFCASPPNLPASTSSLSTRPHDQSVASSVYPILRLCAPSAPRPEMSFWVIDSHTNKKNINILYPCTCNGGGGAQGAHIAQTDNGSLSTFYPRSTSIASTHIGAGSGRLSKEQATNTKYVSMIGCNVFSSRHLLR
jgi:hypothetical protein